MHAYWEKLQTLVAAGRPFVAVTLVDVLASAPAVVGAKMLVTSDGLFHGTVGGGKIELKAIADAQELLRSHTLTRFVEWNLQTDVGMTCGGVVRLYFETYNITTWPIAIFGAGHCSQALVRLLLTMNCQITVIDPRDEWLRKFPADSPAKLRLIHAVQPLAHYVCNLPPQAFVLCMTMGHATDQPILIEILRERAAALAEGRATRFNFPYVGAIGSVAKAAALKRGLIAAGIPETLATPNTMSLENPTAPPIEPQGFYCPIGFPVGTNDPAEIAVSVAAQLLAIRDATTRR